MKTIVAIAAPLTCGFAAATEIMPQQVLGGTLQSLSALEQTRNKAKKK
jgi:hypothetical protein